MIDGGQLAVQYFKEYKLEYLFELKQHFVRMLYHVSTSRTTPRITGSWE
jgi:hypothetical protein